MTGIANGFRAWETRTWRPLGICLGAPSVAPLAWNAVTFSPDSQFLVTIDGEGLDIGNRFRVWRMPKLEELPGLESNARSAGFASAAFTSDGAHFIAGNRDGGLVVWNFATRKVVATPKAHSAWINSMAVSRGSHSRHRQFRPQHQSLGLVHTHQRHPSPESSGPSTRARRQSRVSDHLCGWPAAIVRWFGQYNQVVEHGHKARLAVIGWNWLGRGIHGSRTAACGCEQQSLLPLDASGFSSDRISNPDGAIHRCLGQSLRCPLRRTSHGPWPQRWNSGSLEPAHGEERGCLASPRPRYLCRRFFHQWLCLGHGRHQR